MTRDIIVGDLVRYRPSWRSHYAGQIGRVIRDAGEAEKGPDQGRRFFQVRFKRSPRFVSGPSCRPVILICERELTFLEPSQQPERSIR